ncbi:hypothetical protein L1987_76470 [Smallanthus sonchifolius]|uniref:Uncharacterized protein n=1 Tax=Smallanthus sonchifolius TaxID=185202 RepID=A0ACB8Z7S3_9ASTR|nr:hypothetical protein L1987_76470 [Smallanthus sonchifolius]
MKRSDVCFYVNSIATNGGGGGGAGQGNKELSFKARAVARYQEAMALEGWPDFCVWWWQWRWRWRWRWR